MIDFKPSFFLNSPWLQTVIPAMTPHISPSSELSYHIIDLELGDKLFVAENRPLKWRTDGPIAILQHGLTGSFESTYMLRVARKLNLAGVNVIRVNLRGARKGIHLSKSKYHIGRTLDTYKVLSYIDDLYPNAKKTLIGFSLGGAIAINASHDYADMNIERVIAVSSPLDLEKSCLKLITQSRFFNNYFIKAIQKELEYSQQFHGINFNLDFNSIDNLWKLDDTFTCFQNGNNSALEYYRSCSSINKLSKINHPVTYIASYDDPVIDCEDFTSAQNHMECILTNRGGHVGFVGLRAEMWLDKVILSKVVR